MLVVNLFGGPGAGKSKNAYLLCAALKEAGVTCELVTEWVKDAVWENRTEILACQPYIFGKQLGKLARLEGKCPVVVTDSPIPMQAYYDPDQSQFLRGVIKEQFNKFDNLNFFMLRTEHWDPKGRLQDDISEAMHIDSEIRTLLSDFQIPYNPVRDYNGNMAGVRFMVDKVLKKLEII